MYKLKLCKGLSYSGPGIRVTRENPYVVIEDDERAKALLATKYFTLVEDAGEAPDILDDDEGDGGAGGDGGTPDSPPAPNSSTPSDSGTNQQPGATGSGSGDGGNHTGDDGSTPSDKPILAPPDVKILEKMKTSELEEEAKTRGIDISDCKTNPERVEKIVTASGGSPAMIGLQNQ